MEEKKYLKWYNKVGYGSGDIAGNVVFAFLSSFIMIYFRTECRCNWFIDCSIEGIGWYIGCRFWIND